MATTAREIDYTTAQPDGPPEITRPFVTKGDTSAVVVMQRYKQTRAGFLQDRLYHKWVPGVSKHPDFDESYTNLIPYSNNFANAAWLKSYVTATANALANPWNGDLNATKILETSANNIHSVSYAFLDLTAGTHTAYAIIKGGLGRSWVYFQAGLEGRAYFNLDTGATANVYAGTTATATRIGAADSGWWIISLTYTALAVGYQFNIYSVDDDGSTVSFAGNTAKGFYLAQVQVEAASEPGPVVITGATATTLDLSAYLQTTSEPEVTPTALYRFTRTFASTPATHYDPASRLFERPVMHDILSGSNYAVSFSPDGSWVFASRKPVTNFSLPAVSYTNPDNEQGLIGHQQVTVEMDNSAQSFYLDDSDSTIKNALSTAMVGGTGSAANFYITRWPYGVLFSWAGVNPTVKALTVTDTEITIGERTVDVGTASSTGPIEFLSGGTVKTSVRTVSSAGHGYSAGNRVALYNGDKIVAVSKVVSATTDTFTISTADLPDADAVVTHCVADKDGTRYVNGAIDCSARIATRFYLPGVTSGITTMADIPNFTPTIDPVNWLAQIVAYSALPSVNTYVVIETSALERWLDGPTLVKRVTELQLADALVTASATA